jgi:vancomycin aglycone glucosyltransferase
MNLLLRARIDQHRKSLGLPGIGDFDRHFTRSTLIAVDPELGPLPPDAGAGVVQTGYWRIEDEGALPDDVEVFLEAGAKPVFVGFGSMGDPDPKATAREVVAGIRQAGLRGIIARGWAGLDPQNCGRDFLVVGHLPHGRLFPRVAAVVHHGGAGTTWTVARSGVPHVVVPHLLDQHWWARRLEALGVAGSSIARQRLDAGRLAVSLQQALAPRRRPAIEGLATSLARRDGIRQAVALLEQNSA